MHEKSPEKIDHAVGLYLAQKKRVARRQSYVKTLCWVIFLTIFIWLVVWMFTGYNVLDPQPATHTRPAGAGQATGHAP